MCYKQWKRKRKKCPRVCVCIHVCMCVHDFYAFDKGNTFRKSNHFIAKITLNMLLGLL